MEQPLTQSLPEIYTMQEQIRIALYVQKAAVRFVQGVDNKDNIEEKISTAALTPDDLASLVHTHDVKRLRSHGGTEGISRKLSVSLENGLSMSEISNRRKTHGANKFIEKPPRPFWQFLWDAMQDLTLMILVVCAVVSVGVGIAKEGWPAGTYDGIGIIMCIILVVVVTAVSDYKQSLQFRDLDKEKKSIVVHVTRNGSRQKIPIHELVVGDIVNLSMGDQIPADGLYISGYSLSIDESCLSGESETVIVEKQFPFLLSGTKVQEGSAKMLVTSVGMRTEWGRLMVAMNQGGEDETPLQVKLNGVATVIGKIGLVFAVLTFSVLTVRFLAVKAVNGRMSNWSISDVWSILDFFATAVTILVVAVPEGLPLAVTLSLAFAMKKLMNDKALVRNLSACETMGSVSSICTDKTGTLTTNHMVVTRISICGEDKRVENNKPENILSTSISQDVIKTLMHCIFLNTFAEVIKGKNGKTEMLGSPTEKALLEFGLLFRKDFESQRKESKIIKFEPFNSAKKKMSVLVELPDGNVRAFTKGASEIILRMCDKMLAKNGESIPMSEEQINNIKNAIDAFACEALRTLCLAFKDVEKTSDESVIPNDNYTLISIIGIKDPVRPGVKEAVQTCLAAGVVVRMVTGDNLNTAKAIARECGILTDDGIAIEGSDFRDKSSREMEEIIPKLQVMARSLPLDKHKLVTHLRKEYDEVVAVTGDGTNDAPALHEADIGLAMGIAGTEVAKESADVVILDDNFRTIVILAKWGRSVYINIQKFVQFQLTVNIVALIANFISACVSGYAPLTAVQLLWVNMIMDTLGALALATEPPHDGLMERPPVGKYVNIITKVMWRNIIGQSIYQLIVLGVLEFYGKRILNINSDATLNTLIFNTFVFCQVFNEINSRDMVRINVLRGILSSWVFIIVMVVTVTCQYFIVEYMGNVTNTVPLNKNLWIVSVAVGSVSLITGALLKFIPVPADRNEPPAVHNDDYVALPSEPEEEV